MTELLPCMDGRRTTHVPATATTRKFFLQKTVTTATLPDSQRVKRCRFVAVVTDSGQNSSFYMRFFNAHARVFLIM